MISENSWEVGALKLTLHCERDKVSACLGTFLRLVSVQKVVSATGSVAYPRPEFDIELTGCCVYDGPASCWESHSKGADARDEEERPLRVASRAWAGLRMFEGFGEYFPGL